MSSSGADVSITFTNYSQTTFQRGYWGWQLQAGLGSLNQSPGPTLQAQSGSQVMSASEILSTLATGDYDIFCTWADVTTGARFGVMIHIPVQVFDIGTAPYWYVSYDNQGLVNEAPNWVLSGDDPSYPYTWPTSIGFNIVGTPTAAHTSLSVEVLIQDL